MLACFLCQLITPICQGCPTYTLCLIQKARRLGEPEALTSGLITNNKSETLDRDTRQNSSLHIPMSFLKWIGGVFAAVLSVQFSITRPISTPAYDVICETAQTATGGRMQIVTDAWIWCYTYRTRVYLAVICVVDKGLSMIYCWFIHLCIHLLNVWVCVTNQEVNIIDCSRLNNIG